MSQSPPDTDINRQLTLEPQDARSLARLCGQFNEHLKQIEARLDVNISQRSNRISITGASEIAVRTAHDVIGQLYADAFRREITPDVVHLQLGESINNAHSTLESPQSFLAHAADIDSDTQQQAEDDRETNDLMIVTRKGKVKPRGTNQKAYLRNVLRHDINFGIGPAGTGKTYLAVAAAVQALESEHVQRILLVRPAVEAGEKLGFLPGDLAEKINPYLRPLYDALYEMLGFERVNKYIERQIIEVAPLAYMRGRTLNNAFIILDESQNTTKEQMKMFLTRIGFGSKAVITGDQTQVDLPRGVTSGLRHATTVLDGVAGIGFTHFAAKDVVRHTLVQRIVEAYDKHEENAQ